MARDWTHEPLDTVLRALREGDGPTIYKHRKDLILWLEELRQRREKDRGNQT